MTSRPVDAGDRDGVGTVARRPPRWVIGGEQRGDRSVLELDDRWYGYGCGVVLAVRDRDVERAFEYRSPDGVCAPGDPILFKSATVVGDRLYACTQTEVVVFALPTFEVLAHVSLPCFNDVHHVLPAGDGTLLVAVSGLEMVVRVDTDGNVVETTNVLGEDPWERFSRDVDYRQGVDLKPHRAHPNHLFMIGDEVFVTRFELRDAVSLDDPGRRIVIGRERAHDGVVVGDRVLFTTVDGFVVEASTETLEVVAEHHLDAPDGEDALLGWCRGLHVDGDDVWIGFSRIRPTRFRQTLSWIRTGFTRSCPTRIARYRRSDWSCVEEIDLEPYGLNAVFTIA